MKSRTREQTLKTWTRGQTLFRWQEDKPWYHEQEDEPWYREREDKPWYREQEDKPWHRGQGVELSLRSQKDSCTHGIYNLVILLQLVDDDGTVETALMNYLFAKQVVSRLRNQMNVADLQRKRSYWKQCAFNAVSCFGKWTWCALLPSRTLYKLLLTSRACVPLAVQPLTPVIAVEHLRLSSVLFQQTMDDKTSLALEVEPHLLHSPPKTIPQFLMS